MLTKEQLKELESWGPAKVRAHLARSENEPDAIVVGFKSGPMARHEITSWLAAKHFVALLAITRR